ncbi:MAG: hypothetical protein H8M99_13575 [Gloeobacteraceae cyanobacterium ES-bin-144]|nr:hypothetical protein [Verrucomicrobiales bacterium]
MKKHIHTAAAALVLVLAILSLGACSTMPASHSSDMQTHEMGPPNRSQSMSNSVMKERAN